MKIGSLFSGIGGLELGLERAIPGAEVIWQAERDPYCRDVLEKHWPKAKRYGDVRRIKGSEVERPDLLCGGFPCQGASSAGLGLGLEDHRTGLWIEFERLIGELDPRWVVLENVAAIRTRGLSRVLYGLAACGYDALWDCIPAAAVGAPHLRDRWFCIGWRSPDAISDAVRVNLREQRERDREQRQEQRPSELGDDGPGGALAGHWRRALGQCSPWPVEPSVGRVADGVRDRAHRLRALGNAVVPQCAEVVGRMIAELEGL